MAEPKIAKFTKLDGSTVVVVINTVPPLKALRVARKVAALAGPIVGALAPAGANAPGFAGVKGKMADLDIGLLVDAIGKLDDDEVEGVINVLAAHSSVQGREGTLLACIDLVFAGELEVLARWLVAALEHNFGPIIRALPSGKQGA